MMICNDNNEDEPLYNTDEENIPSRLILPYVSAFLKEQEKEHRKDQFQIDFLRRSRGCDKTLSAMFRKAEQWIFYMDM